MTAPGAVWWLLPVLAGAGFTALWRLADVVTRDPSAAPGQDAGRSLRHIVLFSYSLRVLLAVMLYAISSWGWPILRSLQLPDGFWKFAIDARVYHDHAPSLLHAWQEGMAWQAGDLGLKQYYSVLVAAVYRLFGSHPLYPVLLNCWFAACNGLFAYLIGKQLTGGRTALTAAALVSVWPSSFLWSAQLLKESLTWWLIFAALAVAVSAIRSPSMRRGRRGGAIRQGALYGLLAMVTISLTCLRDYLGALYAVAALVVLGPAGGYALLRRRFGRALRLGGIIMVIVSSAAFARSLDAYMLFSPPQPDRGHYALGLQRWQRGDLKEAEAAFRDAIRLRQRHREAYLALGTLQVRAGAFEEALKAYTDYRDHIAPEDLVTQARAKRLIALVYTAMGDRGFVQGRLEDAMGSYRLALSFDPSVATIHANLGLALAQRGEFDQAIRSMERAMPLIPPVAEQQRTVITAAYGAIRSAAAQALDVLPGPLFARTHRTTLVVAAMNHVPPLALPPFRPPDEVPPDFPEAAEATAAPQPPVLEAATPRGPPPQPLVARLAVIPEILSNIRKGFLGGGGHSVIDASVDISSIAGLLAYLPRALLIGFLAPFPWQWLDAGGTLGGIRVFAGAEMVLVYLLIPSLLGGIWRVGKRRQAEHLFFLAFVLGIAVVLSLVVANLGTLFRMRLFFLLPLLIAAAEGDPLGVWNQIGSWWKRVVDPGRRVGIATADEPCAD